MLEVLDVLDVLEGHAIRTWSTSSTLSTLSTSSWNKSSLDSKASSSRSSVSSFFACATHSRALTAHAPISNGSRRSSTRWTSCSCSSSWANTTAARARSSTRCSATKSSRWETSRRRARSRFFGYGEAGPPEAIGENIYLYHYPLDVLRDLDIVDTPGTNSIERMEEAITREFVPRADLVLFVTSLLQPLTASELDFLTHIREWGKKVVFVVNGIDRRNSDEQIDRVREYLDARDARRRLGGADANALLHQRASGAAREDGARRGASGRSSAASAVATVESDPRNEYPALERYVLETLRETERVRLKLLTPLGVLRNVLKGNVGALDTRLTGRARGRARPHAPFAISSRRTRRRCARIPSAISWRCATSSTSWSVAADRGSSGRSGSATRTSSATRTRSRTGFEPRWCQDAPQAIEGVVHRMVDWTVQRNLKLWRTVFAELDAHTARLRESGALAPHGDTEFQYNREELFARLREPVERRLERIRYRA